MPKKQLQFILDLSDSDSLSGESNREYQEVEEVTTSSSDDEDFTPDDIVRDINTPGIFLAKVMTRESTKSGRKKKYKRLQQLPALYALPENGL